MDQEKLEDKEKLSPPLSELEGERVDKQEQIQNSGTGATRAVGVPYHHSQRPSDSQNFVQNKDRNQSSAFDTSTFATPPNIWNLETPSDFKKSRNSPISIKVSEQNTGDISKNNTFDNYSTRRNVITRQSLESSAMLETRESLHRENTVHIETWNNLQEKQRSVLPPCYDNHPEESGCTLCTTDVHLNHSQLQDITNQDATTSRYRAEPVWAMSCTSGPLRDTATSDFDKALPIDITPNSNIAPARDPVSVNNPVSVASSPSSNSANPFPVRVFGSNSFDEILSLGPGSANDATPLNDSTPSFSETSPLHETVYYGDAIITDGLADLTVHSPVTMSPNNDNRLPDVYLNEDPQPLNDLLSAANDDIVPFLDQCHEPAYLDDSLLPDSLIDRIAANIDANSSNNQSSNGSESSKNSSGSSDGVIYFETAITFNRPAGSYQLTSNEQAHMDDLASRLGPHPIRHSTADQVQFDEDVSDDDLDN